MPALQNIVPRLRDALNPRRNSQVQIMSDLHLEVGQQYQTFDFPVAGRLLILAGDIGRLIDYEDYRTFLERQVGRFDKVGLVLGNHEFFGLSYKEGISRAKQLSREPSLEAKLVLLDRAVWTDETSGSIVMGCTLWSFIPDSARAVVESKVSDYKKIEGWSVDMHNQRHTEDAAWLASKLQSLSKNIKVNHHQQQGRNILVVTHHAPSLTGTSAPEHANNPWTPAFATDLLPRLNTDRVKTWVFGHTHHTTELFSDGVRLIANQRGYVIPGSKPKVAQEPSKWSWTRKPDRSKFDPERVVKL
ncbi:Metallo-dependent phosphatase-like protein [Diaporthe sp. PMI_573]|nr:Metallo-dependent phosphatase-like protein [Diaporthaceae sp. PMI_573]